jgi:hypothetical protein
MRKNTEVSWTWTAEEFVRLTAKTDIVKGSNPPCTHLVQMEKCVFLIKWSSLQKTIRAFAPKFPYRIKFCRKHTDE